MSTRSTSAFRKGRIRKVVPGDKSDISGSAQISPMADIERSSRGSRLVIGEGCFIDSFVKIKFAGGGGDVIIGSHTFINSGCVLYSGNGAGSMVNRPVESLTIVGGSPLRVLGVRGGVTEPP